MRGTSDHPALVRRTLMRATAGPGGGGRYVPSACGLAGWPRAPPRFPAPGCVLVPVPWAPGAFRPGWPAGVVGGTCAALPPPSIDRDWGYGPFAAGRVRREGSASPVRQMFVRRARGARSPSAPPLAPSVLQMPEVGVRRMPRRGGQGTGASAGCGARGSVGRGASVWRTGTYGRSLLAPRCVDGPLCRKDATRHPSSRLHSCSVPRNPGGGLWADAPRGW